MLKPWTKLPAGLAHAARVELARGDERAALRVLASIVMLDDMQRGRRPTKRDDAREDLGLSARAWSTVRRLALRAHGDLVDERRTRGERRARNEAQRTQAARQAAGERRRDLDRRAERGEFDFPPHPALTEPIECADPETDEFDPVFVSPEAANSAENEPIQDPEQFFLAQKRSENSDCGYIRVKNHYVIQTPKAPAGGVGDWTEPPRPAGPVLAPPTPIPGGGYAPAPSTQPGSGRPARTTTDPGRVGIATTPPRDTPNFDGNPAKTRARTPKTAAMRSMRGQRGETVGLQAIHAYEAEISSAFGWVSVPPPGVPGTAGTREQRAMWAARSEVRRVFRPDILAQMAHKTHRLRNPRAVLGVWVRAYRDQWAQDGGQ